MTAEIVPGVRSHKPCVILPLLFDRCLTRYGQFPSHLNTQPGRKSCRPPTPMSIADSCRTVIRGLLRLGLPHLLQRRRDFLADDQHYSPSYSRPPVNGGLECEAGASIPPMSEIASVTIVKHHSTCFCDNTFPKARCFREDRI